MERFFIPDVAVSPVLHYTPFRGQHPVDRDYTQNEKEKIGEFFLRLGILTTEEIERILVWQVKSPEKRFGEIGVEKGYLTEEQIRRFVEENRN